MKKKLILLPILIVMTILFSREIYAKVWTKDLVDSVTLDSGYKFQICTIDFNYDFNSVKDAGFLSDQEKTFAANPDAFPCNKQSDQDVLLANITLNFNKTNWNGGSSPEKLLLLQDGLYSISSFGSILPEGESSKAPISDISPVDWFSTLPAGISAIRGANLINTDPNAAENKKTLESSGLIIFHDPTTGKFTGALFVINNMVYKVSNIVSQVTIPTTLVDYTTNSYNSEIVAGATEALGNNYTGVEINKVYGDYALGAAGFTGTGGGIEFIVHKENNTWNVIWRGNEVAGCSEFKSYPDFPKELNCDPNY